MKPTTLRALALVAVIAAAPTMALAQDEGLAPPPAARASAFESIRVEVKDAATTTSTTVRASGEAASETRSARATTATRGRATKDELAAIAKAIAGAGIERLPAAFAPTDRAGATHVIFDLRTGGRTFEGVGGTAEALRAHGERLKPLVDALQALETRLLEAGRGDFTKLHMSTTTPGATTERMMLLTRDGMVVGSVTEGQGRATHLSGTATAAELAAVRTAHARAQLDAFFDGAPAAAGDAREATTTVSSERGDTRTLVQGRASRLQAGARTGPLLDALNAILKRLEREAAAPAVAAPATPRPATPPSTAPTGGLFGAITRGVERAADTVGSEPVEPATSGGHRGAAP